MAIEIRPLGPALGAEIAGVDLSRPIPDADFAAITRAWGERLVLRVRGQEIGDEDLVRFSARFGKLDPAPRNEAASKAAGAYVPGLAEVGVISNVVVDGVPIGALGAGEASWHADMTYEAAPPTACLLYALEVPETGGDTWFMNMYAAFEALPKALKSAIEGKLCVHDSSTTSAGGLRKGYEPVADVSRTPGARHPLVIVNNLTGRRALYLGRRLNAYVVGLGVDESEALLDELWDHVAGGDFVWRQQWRARDLILWDNRCTMHRRDAFDADARRIMHRTQVRDAGFAA